MPLGKLGDVDGTGESPKLSNPMAALAPLALELGYQLIPQLSVSATFQYAFGFLNNCSDCSSRDLYAGANVAWHFTPTAPSPAGRPWAPAMSDCRSGRHASAGWPSDRHRHVVLRTRVPQRAGWRRHRHLAAHLDGGFLAVSVGVYESLSGSLTIDDRTESMSQDIARTNVQRLGDPGVRGRFDL
jgi:hypothetical protein